MREFKHFDRKVGVLVVRAVHDVELQLDRREPIAELGVLSGERVLLNAVIEPQVEQAIHLGDQK